MNDKELLVKLDIIAGYISAGIHKRTIIKLDQRGNNIENETSAEQPTLEHAKHYCSEAYGLLLRVIAEIEEGKRHA